MTDLQTLIEQHDWASTPLGPREQWPQSLRTAVSICLLSRFPMLIWWGPELHMIYNDAYAPILGEKHPASLGAPGQRVWREIWPVIGPMLESVVRERRGTWSDDQMLVMNRHGYDEETYFTFSYSPIVDETGGIGGIFTAVTETTDRVVSERRVDTLRALASRTAEALNEREALEASVEVLTANSADVPAAAVYLFDFQRDVATRVAAGGDVELLPVSEETEPLERFGRTVQAERVDVDHTVLLPLVIPGEPRPCGALAVSCSRLRPVDEHYVSFFSVAASRIAAAIATARSYEMERRRADALAALDHAKTQFFSNVSHEFRTPLTLILGPVEELLAKSRDGSRAQLEEVHRNALRLLRLVNTMLDFSRIEAGRMQAKYRPVDLAAFTRELTSLFRSAIERAGLELIVETDEATDRAYVDASMWEKIVLNLVSNAFKFTFRGRIRVSLKRDGESFVLSVSDTGVGIAPDQLPHVFDRFHRVEGAQSRSFEGTGIGLALVAELAKLHGGQASVTSTPGEGSTFTVTIPAGSDHLPQARVAEEAFQPGSPAAAFVEETIGWTRSHHVATADDETKQHVLVVDDNSDMREYLRRLLSATYEVTLADNGREALELAVEHPPALVLTDMMMPELDGVGLLRALRLDPRTSDVPVIMLSARAGEEAIIDGLDAGVDDYLVKPFSARELRARVRLQLDHADVRRRAQDAEERYRAFIHHSSEAIWRFELDRPMPVHELTPDEQIAYCFEHAYLAECNDALARQYGYQRADELVGARLPQMLLPDNPDNIAYLRAFIAAGYRLTDAESVEVDRDGKTRYFLNNLTAVIEDGELRRAWGTQRDVTDVKRAQERLDFLARAGARLGASLDYDAIIDELAKLGAEGTGGACSVYLLDRSSLSLASRRATGDEAAPAIDETAERQLHALVKRSESTLVTGEASSEAERHLARCVRDRNLAALLVVPLRAHGRTLGALVLESRSETFTSEVRQLAQDLANRGAAAIDNARLFREAEAANLAKDDFLATLSHELRTPMTATLGWVAMLRLPDLADETFDVGIEALEQSTRAQAKLIDDILDVSRISTGKLRVTLAPTNLRTVIGHAVDTVRTAAEGKQIALNVDIRGGEQPFLGDEDRLQQVVWNVLSNAVKFTPRGGEVRLDAEDDGGTATIVVRDSGEGIAPEVLPNIFERFWQADSSSTRRHAGLGLGLSIVKSLVELHGGTVSAASDGTGHGATFTIRLPMPPVDSERQQTSAKRDVSLDGIAILVVEDEPATRLMLESALRHFAADVTVAASAAEGLTVLETSQPRVIISDIAMPGEDGYSFLASMHERGRRTPVIALTAQSSQDDRERALSAGFDAYLTKPIDPAVLAREVLRLAKP